MNNYAYKIGLKNTLSFDLEIYLYSADDDIYKKAFREYIEGEERLTSKLESGGVYKSFLIEEGDFVCVRVLKSKNVESFQLCFENNVETSKAMFIIAENYYELHVEILDLIQSQIGTLKSSKSIIPYIKGQTCKPRDPDCKTPP